MKKAMILASALTVFSMRLDARPHVESTKGHVKIHEQGKEMVVHASDNAIIHYKSFDVQADEAVWFQMQDSSHRVLNRIEHTRPSHIDGRLISNGIIYLLNPAGVVFGPHSIVDVSGLIVAAAHLSDDDFIHRRDYFTSIGGNVEVSGHLSAKEITLVGAQVFQNGKVDAKVTIYSVGEHYYLGKEGEHLYIKCDKESLTKEEAADFLGCGTTEGYLVHHGGITRADSLKIYGGKGSKIHLAGRMDVSHRDEQRAGGTVVVQGEKIEMRKAHIDVTGLLGGGNVFIGGGENGEGIYPTALEVDCDTLSTIAADSLVYGDGGKIVLYGEKCKPNGLYSVMGGIQGGNAGVIETSGSLFQSLTTKTRMFAPSGKSGIWKIDPYSIKIIDMGGTDLTTFDDGTNNSYVVNASVINNAPAGSTIIFAANNSSGYSPGTCLISVGTPEAPAHINPSNPNVKLIFDTAESSTVRGMMQINGSISSDTILFKTPVTITGPTNISASSSLVFDYDVKGEGSGGLHITAQKELSAQGSITNLGSLQIKTPENRGQFTMTAPTTLQATGDISIGAHLKLLGPATFHSEKGNITFHSTVTSDGPLVLQSSNDVHFKKNLIAKNGSDVFIKTDGDIHFSENINTTGRAPVAPGDGCKGGNVTLIGDSVHLSGIYAGGTAAFPGASGKGGRGGDVQIETQSGLYLNGPIYATGGAGVNGGGQVLPTLVFSGQSLDSSGADSPGNITISGPVFLKNQATLRGQNIQAVDFMGDSRSVLAIDGATSGKAQLGKLSRLGHFVVNDSKGVEICGDVDAHGISLLNSGSEGVVFKGVVTADQISTMANRFAVTFEKPYVAQVVNLRNCVIDTSTSLFSVLRLLTSGPFAEVFNLCTFSLNYLTPPKVVDHLTRDQLAGK
jgi:filamentous hemagglutinin family protein